MVRDEPRAGSHFRKHPDRDFSALRYFSFFFFFPVCFSILPRPPHRVATRFQPGSPCSVFLGIYLRGSQRPPSLPRTGEPRVAGTAPSAPPARLPWARSGAAAVRKPEAVRSGALPGRPRAVRREGSERGRCAPSGAGALDGSG